MVVSARPSDRVVDFIAERLATHMLGNGLELRLVEGDGERPAGGSEEAMSSKSWFCRHWEFLRLSSNKRSAYGGPPLKKWDRPFIGDITFDMMNHSMKRCPSFSPPYAKSLLIVACKSSSASFHVGDNILTQTTCSTH